ncbi:OmpA family protein [Pseudacidovorax intermedius]|uniref:Peptidoglycan-associated protein n=1 Tax=Pseudacidovorax intermedius TaxID=433924 RepID=A0A147GVT3_9BURK|nr:OmpA family protein [Pseudacidovorax intermedius]KTT21742.1 lipoprotein [Pseudacidovorax intermedius]
MTTNTLSRFCLALAVPVLLAACGTAPRDGVEDTTYYYANPNKARTGVARVQAAPPAAPALDGPAGVARIVYFDFDRVEVKPEYRAVVEAHARYLREQPRARVLLEGHTDDRGGRAYNVALGQRRAESVRQALQLGGVAGERMEATSWGMEKPASSERTEAGWQLNRRVEFVYR